MYMVLLLSCPTYYLIQFSEISSTRGESCHGVNDIATYNSWRQVYLIVSTFLNDRQKTDVLRRKLKGFKLIGTRGHSQIFVWNR